MAEFETFDHTADMGVEIRASRLEEVFEAAAKALLSLIVEHPERVRPEHSVVVKLTAPDPPDLLVDWLRELLYLSETEGLLVSHSEVTLQGDGMKLRATCRGEAVDWERHGRGHEVKAVTYHDLVLERDGDDWVARVVFDI